MMTVVGAFLLLLVQVRLQLPVNLGRKKACPVKGRRLLRRGMLGMLMLLIE